MVTTLENILYRQQRTPLRNGGRTRSRLQLLRLVCPGKRSEARRRLEQEREFVRDAERCNYLLSLVGAREHQEDEGGGTKPRGFAVFEERGYAWMDRFSEAQRLPGA